MKLFGADENSEMIRKISDWFGMIFNPNQSERNRIFRNHSD